MQVPHRFPGQRLSLWSYSKGVLWHEPSQSTTSAASLTRDHRREGGARRWAHRAVSLSGFCAVCEPREGKTDGDSLAAGAADPGGVDAGDGVGGLRVAKLVPPRTGPMTYRIRLLETEEGWAVSCLDLPGCHSQGNSREAD
jgi:hypothetical protein